MTRGGKKGGQTLGVFFAQTQGKNGKLESGERDSD